MTEHVVVDIADGIQTIRLNRPDKKNALTGAMYAAVAKALTEADGDPAVRVSLVTGTADSFTSGNDINDFLARGTGQESPAFVFLRAIASIEKPLIAGVNGLAVGVGVTMLLHCDLVYAAETATFQMPFVSLGVIPEAASSMLLPRLVGHQRAAELLLLGETFTAAKAHALGLVNAVHPAAGLAAAVRGEARKLAAQPPGAVRLTKALLRGDGASVKVRMEEEGSHFARLLASPEAREAMQAFLERRKPDFSRFA